MNVNVNYAELLNGLSEEEKQVALQILKEYADTGQSAAFDEIQWAEYDEIPVDIETFLHDRRYLGNALYDAEGKFTLFPYWENVLKDIFPDNLSTKYNNVVFTGAIGLGKSTIAVICILYLLYRLLCLKDPYVFFGLQPVDKITISLINITLENARGVALDKMNQMILVSPWFLAHGEMAGETNLVYRPNKHIEIVVASSNNQIIGRALFANFTDEVNFSLVNNPEKQKQKMLKLITQIDARMKSRFLRGTYLPTLNILASSKDTEQSFLEAYIANKQENESKNTLVVDEPQWVVDARKDSPIKFWVGLGNKFLPNELLPLTVTEEQLDEYRAKGYELWQVPIGYLDTFQQNLDEAICSIIGKATASSLKYISGDKLNQTKTDTYANPFRKDVIEVGNDPEDTTQYSDYFDLSLVSEDDIARPIFLHLDMSLGSGGKGDKTGIAGVWATGKVANNTQRKLLMSGDDSGDSGSSSTALEQIFDEDSLDMTFKLAFSVSVKAPRGANISFAKNRNFIRWLRNKGFNIKGISMDSWGSANMQQDLISDGFKVEQLSVDRVQKDPGSKRPLCIPYHYFKTAINERRIKIYKKCDQLTDEIIGLERKADGHIDHTKEGINSKDQCDAVCGATYLASQYAGEYSYNYGDNLSAAIEANSEITNEVYKRQQLVVDFEEELKRISFANYAGKEEADKIFDEPKNVDFTYFDDISDGIIII